MDDRRKTADGYLFKISIYNAFRKTTKIVEEIAGNITDLAAGNCIPRLQSRYGNAWAYRAYGFAKFLKEEIYKTALAFNVYWFPQTYLDIAFHFDKAEQDYSKIPKELLSKTFPSAMGYQTIRKSLAILSGPRFRVGKLWGIMKNLTPLIIV